MGRKLDNVAAVDSNANLCSAVTTHLNLTLNPLSFSFQFNQLMVYEGDGNWV